MLPAMVTITARKATSQIRLTVTFLSVETFGNFTLYALLCQ